MAFEDLHRPLSNVNFNGVVRWMILLSGVMLLLEQFWGPRLIPVLGLVPPQVLQHGWVWQPFTYVLLHGGLFHWLFNMFVFWMFGRELEVRWGTPRFLAFCVVTGLGAALSVIVIAPHTVVPTIGSSGIVFGLLVAFALAFPQATMYLYFLIPMKVWQVAVLFGVIEIMTLVGSQRSAAPWAHLGGMLAGFLFLKVPWSSLGRWRPSLKWIRPAEDSNLHVLTDDLAKEVDRILDKVSHQGSSSLSEKEKNILDRYVKKKR